jgi:phage protein D
VKRLAAALALTLAAASGHAAMAYVSDELVLGVYAEENSQGERLTTLHSGAAVETLSTSGEFTQVRLADGTMGWVKSTFLTMHEPATVRVKQLEEELDRSRATTPALAEAAARSEVELLQGQLKAKQAELDAARAARALPQAAALVPPVTVSRGVAGGLAVGALAVAAACGFWLGYATLARRVKQKFGGIRVY